MVAFFEYLFLFVVLLLMTIGLSFYFDAWECRSKAAALGIPSSYGLKQGCIITHKGEEISINRVEVD